MVSDIQATYARWEDAMARRIIDISVPLQSDIASDPPGTEPRITYIDHKQSAEQVCAFFPGLTPAELPEQEGWAVERIDISTHNGTHLDAPWHFASTMDGGKRAITIDEVPLEWCMQPGVKLDFRHFRTAMVHACRRRGGAETHRHTLKPSTSSSSIRRRAALREADYAPTAAA
jgi:kynurenine formamidase